MTVYVQDPDFTLHLGDVRDVLPTLEADSVDCVATSPPFYGLRDYGTGSWAGGDPDCDHVKTTQRRDQPERPRGWDGAFRNTGEPIPVAYGDACGKCGAHRTDRQIGLEVSPDLWVETLVGVFRECRRILKPSGTLWIECGDSYAATMTSDRRHTQPTNRWRGDGIPATDREPQTAARRTAVGDAKPKDLIGAPWLLAFALRADGWWLRQCLIWAKPNCMPESARDRCTTSHSYVFLLSKRPRYWFDGDAIREPHEEPWRGHGEAERNNWSVNGNRGSHETVRVYNPAGRNARSVWTIPTQGYPEAHFATWPEKLAEQIILAGCPEWVCEVCGKPRERISERPSRPEVARGSGRLVPSENGRSTRKVGQAYQNWLNENPAETIGFTDCGHGSYRPGRILDPFMGAGTTALVARRLGRASVGVELNESYAAMCARRLQQLSLLA